MSGQATRTTRLRTLVLALVFCCLAMWTSGPAEGQVLRRLTDLNPDDFAGWSVDDAGSTAVAAWRGDRLGTNPDHVYQIFRWELPGGVVTQLTDLPEGLNLPSETEWTIRA